MRLLPCLTLVLAGGLASPVYADILKMEITVTAGKSEAKNLPVCVPLSLPPRFAEVRWTKLEGDFGPSYGQLTKPGLLTDHIQPEKPGEVRRDLHFVVPALKAQDSKKLQAKLDTDTIIAALPDEFFWTREDGLPTLIRSMPNGLTSLRQPVLKYMGAPYDDSTPELRNKTYKVFHHLYDPQGERFVTNGGHTDPHTDPKKMLYPHHRGLMFGFNKVTYGNNQKADTWHCTGNVHVAHAKILDQERGPVLGRHRVLLHWNGNQKDTFAHEIREVTVYNVPGGTLLDWANRLTTTGGPIKLDGDPQHAGFQFRASNEVAEKTAKQTYYLRPDGKGKPGETRNWEPKSKKGPVNVPWKACCFVLGDQRYTVAYLDSPKNPREARHSERDYGRFGYYFEYEVTEKNPLNLNYRLWLQRGEMDVPQVQALYDAFVTPPTTVVKR